MAYQFSTQNVPSVDVLFIRDEIDSDAVPAFLGAAFPELYGQVGRQGIAAAGPPFVIYHAFGPDRIDAQVCAPVSGPAHTEGRFQAGTVAAATVVRTLHVGRYEDLGAAYAALAEWVGDHGLAPAGPIRERYLTGVGDDMPPEAYRTELDQPVEPATIASPAGQERRDEVGVG